jgi:2-C-methyl-D-erythritol 4-phosphate cytidylyltransferase
VIATGTASAPDVMIVDSIRPCSRRTSRARRATSGRCASAPRGSCASPRRPGTATFVVGHVTKGGGIAGPKTLEHIVDTVLYFEGESTLDHRVLRATKNRFGSVDEIGVFRMTQGGLIAVENPSELFLGDRDSTASGSAVTALLEGTRPVLVEVQALAAKAGYGTPQRVATGYDGRRLALLLAVLDKRAGLNFSQLDVFLNVVGGVRLNEPAGDLAVAGRAGVEHLRPLAAARRGLPRRGRTRRRDPPGVADRAAARRGGEDGDDGSLPRGAGRAEARSVRHPRRGRAHGARAVRARVRVSELPGGDGRAFDLPAPRRAAEPPAPHIARSRTDGGSRDCGAVRDVGVVIVAGGQGSRTGGAELKQFRWVAGKPMLLHSVHAFMARADVHTVVVVLPKAHAADPPPWLFQCDVERLLVSTGGRERADSVANGLEDVPEECAVVLVHDAARPFVPDDVIERVVAAARQGTGALPALPVVDTLKEVDDGGRVVRTVDRAPLWRAQTPQGFPRAMLDAAHARARRDGLAAT